MNLFKKNKNKDIVNQDDNITGENSIYDSFLVKKKGENLHQNVDNNNFNNSFNQNSNVNFNQNMNNQNNNASFNQNMNNQNNNANFNQNMNNQNIQKTPYFEEKQYNSGFLDAHTKVSAASSASRILLVLFYVFIIGIGLIIYLMLRSNKYEFYLKNEQVSISIGSTYQIELLPKDVRYFDYLNYNYKVSDQSVATVDEYGTVTAVGEGTTDLKISLKRGFGSKVMKITSENINVESLTLGFDKSIKNYSGNVYDMIPNETVTVHAYANNDENIKLTVNYSSNNENVVKVDQFGNVTAIQAGTAIITGERNGIIGSIRVRVTIPDSPTTTIKPSSNPSMTNLPTNNPSTPKQIDNLLFPSASISIQKGNKAQLTVTISPSDVVAPVLTWSSNNDNVSVDSNGNITANKIGTSVITVRSSNGKTASCEVNVTDKVIKATSISLNSNNVSMLVGTAYQLTTVILPSDTTERVIEWSSSNSNVASVSNGMIIGKSAGNAVVTASIKGTNIKAQCSVVITSSSQQPQTTLPKTIQSISFANTSISLKKGESSQLNVTINPVELSNTKLVWTSSNTSVVTVDNNGKITAKSVGQSVITVTTSNNKKATCNVKVSDTSIAISNISLSSTNISLNTNEAYQLNTFISPSNATLRELEWSSSNTNIATVNSNGLIKGINPGNAVITVKVKNSNIQARCNVTINKATPTVTYSPVPVYTSTPEKLRSVSIGITQTQKKVGETLQLTARLTPSNATINSIKWSSSNQNVAEVNCQGINCTVKLLSVGTAVITVNVDGQTASGTVIVKGATSSPTVTPKPTSSSSVPNGSSFSSNYVSVSPLQLSVDKGGTASFTVTALKGGYGKVSVSSSDANIVTVSISGGIASGTNSGFIDSSSTSSFSVTVKGVKSGTAYINLDLSDYYYEDNKGNDTQIKGSAKVGILVK